MKPILDIWERPPDKHLHVFVGIPSKVGGECFIRLFPLSFPHDISHPSIPTTSSLRRQLYPLSTLLLSCHLLILSTWFKLKTLSAPVLGKRSRAADDPELADLPWLEEVHSKIWNRKDLRPQLFRKVEVTQAHYAALQKRLKELHSDRDSPDYDGTKSDVLSVKLDFLRSLAPAEDLSPRHPNDNDDRVEDDDDSRASNEDDPEIKSLFPSILSFLDLSTLKLKENVPNRCLPLPLLLRQEYKDISR
jgi:hypothetical protein